MNLGIEFHDATVHGIRTAGPDAVVEMTVYVHCSAGRPGQHAGTGWYQSAEMFLSEAAVSRAPSTWPTDLYGGIVTVDGEGFENVVPLPFDRTGRVNVELQGGEGWFAVSAARVRIQLKGTPGEPGQFPGIDE